MIRRPPRSTLSSSSAASDVYKRQATGSSFQTKRFAHLMCLWSYETLRAVDVYELPDNTPVDPFDSLSREPKRHQASICRVVSSGCGGANEAIPTQELVPPGLVPARESNRLWNAIGSRCTEPSRAARCRWMQPQGARSHYQRPTEVGRGYANGDRS